MVQIEKQIANEIATANGLSVTKLGLRFDKVAIRLLRNIRRVIEKEVPKNIILLLTITAPIRLPAKTENELNRQIIYFLESGIHDQDSELTVFQNVVRIRTIKPHPGQTTKFIGLVHNPDVDSKLLFNLVAQWLLNA